VNPGGGCREQGGGEQNRKRGVRNERSHSTGKGGRRFKSKKKWPPGVVAKDKGAKSYIESDKRTRNNNYF